MSSSKPGGVYGATAGGGDHRRKWDRTEWEVKAAERLTEERQKAAEAAGKVRRDPHMPKVRREMLKPRDYSVDLESKVGRSVVISKTTPSAETGGFYCDVCDCVVKDSINFLDHINGKNHQRNMGMSMKVKRSSLDDVRMRFVTKKEEKEQKKKEYDLEQRLEEVKEEEARLADARRQKKQDIRKRKRGEDIEPPPPETDDSFAKMMGFSGFASTKNK